MFRLIALLVPVFAMLAKLAVQTRLTHNHQVVKLPL